MKKIFNRVAANFGLKIMAVVFAIIFWMVVVNIDDPDTTKQFSIPVTVENESTITEMGKVYEILEDSDVAVFSVTGKRSIIENLSGSDFKATADMKQIEGLSLVPIEVTAQRYAGQLTITKKNQNMQVSVENMQSSQFVISAASTGTPAEGCGIGSIEVTPNVITVSGAESVVSKIAKVVATANVSGMSTDITDNVIPVLYDADGIVIQSDNLTYSQQTVAITAYIQNTKSVPISYEVTGTPAQGYEFIGAECAPETVNIQGDAELLNQVGEITIPTEVLDMTGLTETRTETIDLTPYLPEGISLTDVDSAKVAITITIEALETRTFSVPVRNITVENLGDGLTLDFDDRTIDVVVTGLKANLDTLDEDDMTGTLDAEDLSAGTHECAVAFEVDAAIGTISTEPVASVTIIDESADEDVTAGSTNTTGGSTNNNDASNSTGNNTTGGTTAGSGTTTDDAENRDEDSNTTE